MALIGMCTTKMSSIKNYFTDKGPVEYQLIWTSLLYRVIGPDALSAYEGV